MHGSRAYWSPGNLSTFFEPVSSTHSRWLRGGWGSQNAPRLGLGAAARRTSPTLHRFNSSCFESQNSTADRRPSFQATRFPRLQRTLLRTFRRRFSSTRHQSIPSSPLPPSSSPLRDLKERTVKERSLVFVSNSSDPYHNLSLEHYLLTNSDHDSRILFLYVNRPCVVFGRNQNPWAECNLPAIAEGLPLDLAEEKVSHPTATTKIEIIRRRSGGGTVFHDAGNLNYCAIVPNDKSFSRNTHAEMVVRALQSLQQTRPDFAQGQEIKVNERHDIVMRSTNTNAPDQPWLKVSGSAYKITRGRALHHGTLLFNSPHLKQISRLLNGLGKDLITTKGVASVRSPVANLLSMEAAAATSPPSSAAAVATNPPTTSQNDQNSKLRNALRQDLEHAIIAQWHKLYSHPTNQSPTPSTTIALNDSDCTLPEIAKGIEELRSPEWRYGQTPRFTFTSASASGSASASSRPAPHTRVGGGVVPGAAVRLQLEVNRGVVERVLLDAGPETDDSGNGNGNGNSKDTKLSTEIDLQTRRRLEDDDHHHSHHKGAPLSLKVWEVTDWAHWLRRLHQGQEEQTGFELAERESMLLQRVAADASVTQSLWRCFPAWPDRAAGGGR